ncbi:hypothetical protein HY493_04050 [Candidatus Woesearchaeota archaeon]|nr:hypothetical protein [Candidatus Woesearchaeota archaeon]
MNVNDVAKLNELMKNLQRHGMAVTAPEAYQQAQEIMGGKKVVTLKEDEQGGIAVESVQVPGTAMIESRVNLMLDMHSKRIEQQFTTMKDTISALAMELERMKLELRRFSDTKAHKVVQVVQETQKSLKTEEKAPHPRQGNYQPGDVDIGKMFYFGHK